MDLRRAAHAVFRTVLALVPAFPALAQQPPPATGPAVPNLTLNAYTGFAYPDPNAVDRVRELGGVTECRGELRFYFETKVAGAVTFFLQRMPEGQRARMVIEFGPPGVLQAKTEVTVAESREESFLCALSDLPPGQHRLSLRMADDSPLRGLLALKLVGPAMADAHACTVERRNAASVHLGYPIPPEHSDDIEWFYCEVTPRTDPLWTYYMATGWHRGYFGIQVNSPTERRVIFSVWDSGNEGIDRNKVAAEDRVQLIAKGENVHASGFGNEGTGGHSHLVHDWKLGDTFRFLVRAQPDGTHTTYTGWFWFAQDQRWGLIASFRAPKDGGRLHGLYSFNENFSGANGDLLRDCEFGNLWARTGDGEWLALTTARFTHDGHGKEQRLDRSAGVRGTRFYLQNGGFMRAATDAVTTARATMKLDPAVGSHPDEGILPNTPNIAGDK